jgi:filamentous hemagglutinin family protein
MRHATLNHVYRLVWSTLHQTWVAVSELTRGKGKKATRRLAVVAAVATATVTSLAHAGPAGGQITAGSGTISQSGTTTTVNQASQNLSLNWQSFNTNSAETVNFSQPSTSAIAVNRIGDQNPTQFLGKLNANGQVYLINPNGIVFGAGAQVNVGGLVASTLDTTDSKAAGSSRTFSGAGTGSVVNKGTITTANGGYVAFVGKQVKNQGTITAPGGAAALAAGSDVTLSFTGDKLVNLQVNKSTVDTLAENGGLVQADGGAVWMSAGARDTVLASVVNNTGIVQARSVQNVNGTIVLEAGSAGTTTNSGTLDVAGTTAGQHGGSAKVLGGTVNSVRAYDIGALSGDTGYAGTVELRHELGQGSLGYWQAIAFVDSAYVKVNRHATTADNSGSLSGAGVGLNWRGPDQWQASLSVANRLGNAPSLVDDQSSVRGWASVSKAF